MTFSAMQLCRYISRSLRFVRACRVATSQFALILLIFSYTTVWADTTTTSSPSSSPCQMTVKQKIVAEKITSLFENSVQDLQYGYCEDIGDGRGYTSGRAGFCTGTGDAILVLKSFLRKKEDKGEADSVTYITKFIPSVEKISKSADTSWDEDKDYCRAWSRAAQASLDFIAAQDEVVDTLYYKPAMALADTYSLNYALSRAILYDTIIQHGNEENDPDSLRSIVVNATKVIGGKPGDPKPSGGDNSVITEKEWVLQVLASRRQVLSYATNVATREEWAKSVPRADALRYIADGQKNWALSRTVIMQTDTYDDKIASGLDVPFDTDLCASADVAGANEIPPGWTPTTVQVPVDTDSSLLSYSCSFLVQALALSVASVGLMLTE